MQQNDIITVALDGRITSANASEWQGKLMCAVEEHPGCRLVLDALNLEYISSAGLRVLLALAKRLNGDLTLRDVSPEVYEVFVMTGFTEMMKVVKRMRQMSVEGCEVVGRGAVGTVYRVDEDTIVKVYDAPDCLPMIENEQKRSKQALLKGIPTAISYDVVRVGDKYGSVFEMLKASTFNDLLLAHPDQLDELVRQYAHFIRSIHTVEMDPGELPEAKEVFLGYLDALKGTLPEALRRQLIDLFDAMPEDLHIIHGDIQMKNVMVSDGEPILIDMDTLSVGDPVYDFAGLFVGYKAYPEDEADNSEKFLGISRESCDRIWDAFIHYYFDDRTIPANAEDKARIVAYVRFLYLVAVLGIGLPEFRQMRIDHSIEHLSVLVKQVDSLALATKHPHQPNRPGQSSECPKTKG